MSEYLRITPEVKELVDNIIAKHNLAPVLDVKYSPGSKAGDGYASATIAVKIIYSKGTLELFLKCSLNIKSTEQLPIKEIYANEAYFYDAIYPTYQKFVEEQDVQQGFNNAPKCYGTINRRVVALENLKTRGFTLFDRSRHMNRAHLELVLRTFAKFHAVSFAYKDQKREKYEELVQETFDAFSSKKGGTVFMKLVKGNIVECLESLNPEQDKEILQRCKVEDLIDAFASADRNLSEYSILTQGDCWCNNMMFLYESEDIDNPIDIMLIDWQLVRPSSPVYDISYFFLTIASEDALNKTKDYLKLYHEELSKQIQLLGSDPEKLYPFQVFMNEWKKYCKFGFSMAFMLIKGMLSSADEIFNLESVDLEGEEGLKNLYPKYEKQDQYLGRMKVLANYMISNDYI